jgi:type III secretion system FlhB-like substrate exporter
VLSKLDIGEAIPVELYQAVAEILAFVYQMNEKRRQASSSR